MKKLRSARPSPALVIAVLALIVSTGGTAYAVETLTGADIVDGSLTGVDIDDGSIGLEKLSADVARGDVDVLHAVEQVDYDTPAGEHVLTLPTLGVIETAYCGTDSETMQTSRELAFTNTSEDPVMVEKEWGWGGFDSLAPSETLELAREGSAFIEGEDAFARIDFFSTFDGGESGEDHCRYYVQAMVHRL